MSALERLAVQRLIDKATAVGVEIPETVRSAFIECGDPSWPAAEWERLHPEDDAWCCVGAIHRGFRGCTCWVPEYDVEQSPPRPPTCPADLRVRERMCGDCAFRPDSPERTDTWMEETLLELATTGNPFWCHQGMRRPARWRHPDGRVVEGSTADWTPARIGAIPFQADGTPGLLCAGWAAYGRRVEREAEGVTT